MQSFDEKPFRLSWPFVRDSKLLNLFGLITDGHRNLSPVAPLDSIHSIYPSFRFRRTILAQAFASDVCSTLLFLK